MASERSPILETVALGSPAPWQTLDPFLFAVHHNDKYPAGTETMGVAPGLLRGRSIGSDFSNKDGFSMYHGRSMPGFPQHPHAGFETVTIARHGFIDHSDSLGATARFGDGDLQWMTAGRGISHAEMFPLVNTDAENPLELFQLWLNLPAVDKKVQPYFSMQWGEAIPRVEVADAAGKTTTVTLYAGAYGETKSLAPPPNSWAARPESDLAIWTLKVSAGAAFDLPPAREGTNRMLYYFHGGQTISVNGKSIRVRTGMHLAEAAAVRLVNENTDAEAEFLLLQARPIGEPVVQHGPFVANTAAEMRAIITEYQRTEFGGWPWESEAPAHARAAGRFAIHADGTRSAPPQKPAE
eukprot:a509815_202.p1 GENE.a509815_202~~a509815_202.p1  ORF type:complete len:409 (-),score=125.16 a509815_202:15-1073(-)